MRPLSARTSFLFGRRDGLGRRASSIALGARTSQDGPAVGAAGPGRRTVAKPADPDEVSIDQEPDYGGIGGQGDRGEGEIRSEERRVGEEGRSRWSPDH